MARKVEFFRVPVAVLMQISSYVVDIKVQHTVVVLLSCDGNRPLVAQAVSMRYLCP